MDDLTHKAALIRRSAIAAVVAAGSGHVAGPLDMADIFAALFFKVLTHDPKRPDWEGRDRLVLSNGHICPALYAAMCHAGYARPDELEKTLRRFGTKFQGHPHRTFFPALETSSGPLGSGLSQAVGMALALRIDGKSNQVYALLSDAEHQSGNVWEAAQLAGKERLANLTAVVDRNNIQIDGNTEDIMPLEPLRDKYESFGWQVLDINGHDFAEIISAFETARAMIEKQVVILAHTIAGKGVSFMEGKYEWHSRPFTKEEAEQALRELAMSGE